MRKLMPALAALTLFACGGSEATPDAGTNNAVPDAGLPADAAIAVPDAGPSDLPPTAQIVNVAPLSWFHGTFPVPVKATDDLGVVKIEIFAGDSTTPVSSKTINSATDVTNTVNVATATIPDGLIEIYARATDSTGHTTDSAKVKVVVCNTGTVADLIEPEDGQLEIPATNYNGEEVDQKRHWNNPSSTRKILGTVVWTPPANPWKLALNVGYGECPDNGKALCAEGFSTEGAIAVVAEPQGADDRTGMHFIHVRPADFQNHPGEKLPFRVAVYLWP